MDDTTGDLESDYVYEIKHGLEDVKDDYVGALHRFKIMDESSRVVAFYKSFRELGL